MAAYKKTYKVDHLEAYTAYGAQAFLVLANAIAKSNGTRASITKNLYNQSFPKGVIGAFKIDNTGDPSLGGVTVDQYVGGQSKIITVDQRRRPRWRSRHSANRHSPEAEQNDRRSARMATDSTARRPILALAPRSARTGRSRSSASACSALVALWLVENLAREPKQFTLVFLAGITNGSIYALVALGYTLVYGILELINFAHGDVFTWGAMVDLHGRRQLDRARRLAIGFRARSARSCGADLRGGLLRGAQHDDRARRLPAACATHRDWRPLITAIGMSFVLLEPDRRDLRLRLQELQRAPADGRDLPHRQPGLRLGQADRPAHHGARAARARLAREGARAGARRCARPRRIATRRG